MDTSQVQVVKRKTIPLTFSREFESLLLNHQMPHTSLSHDLEAAAHGGLALLRELEDVRDLTHARQITYLVELTNTYCQMSSSYFKQWHLSISEDLLDEIDLLILTHGEDLVALGLKDDALGTVIVMAALAALITSGVRP